MLLREQPIRAANLCGGASPVEPERGVVIVCGGFQAFIVVAARTAFD